MMSAAWVLTEPSLCQGHRQATRKTGGEVEQGKRKPLGTGNDLRVSVPL